VNKESITRVSLEEWAKIKGQTDWARIDAMTEEEIEQNALNDPDNQQTSCINHVLPPF